jgi:hypothetical protein
MVDKAIVIGNKIKEMEKDGKIYDRTATFPLFSLLSLLLSSSLSQPPHLGDKLERF